TVTADSTPPTIISVGNLGDNDLVTVLFSEPVEAVTGTNRLNYSINNGVSVNGASFGGDARSVVLRTSPLSGGILYTLTVNNVRDRATNPNTIAQNTQRTFTIDFTPLDSSARALDREPLGPCSRRTGLVISEIMFHPTNRPDAKELEFIELYNSQVYAEDLGGFRLTGDISYTFPPNTTIAAGGYLVVAPVPADVQSVFGISGVLGGFTNRLSNGSGTIRIRNRFGAVLLEANFSGGSPWPVAADGAGHSLVLARPSYGEANPEAWEASDLVGGTPGRGETAAPNPYQTIVINEFLAHTDPPDWDYIELYNYSASPVNLTGCVLTDDPVTNKFLLPNVTIPARGFVVYYETNMGFALSAAGETLYLKNPSGTKIIDAVRFKGQENGVATGRYPDGAPQLYRLLTKTPGTANGRIRVSNVVLNEIMYHPVTGSSDDEFVELYNRGPSAVNLGGWRLSDGVSFTFPTNALIPSGGYVVVANKAAHLMTNYAGLTVNNTFGDLGGNLGNGERVALTMPDTIVSTNGNVVETNLIHITVDEVTFRKGGRWGQWADGGGSSLELADAHTDHRQASNWADSDESNKSAWTNIEYTGVLDNGQGAADALHIFLQGAGECLVDNVEVFSSGGANLIANPDFESSFTGWFGQGTCDQSYWQATGGFGGGKCLHLVASGRGDTGANHVRSGLTSALSAGETVTLRAKVRWLKGNPEILLRLHGNWLEAYGNICGARNLGTPGAANSRAVSNSGPAIHDVCHSPLLPAGGQAVTVRAQVTDPDGLGSLTLKYRLDPATNYTALSMAYNGAGLYSANIPGQLAGTLAAFYIEATDYSTSPVITRFPGDAPARECLVRFGESVPNTGRVGTYRFWFTQATNNRWTARERNSNQPLDATFVYNASRAVYNIGTLYSGSPWHTPGYNGPLNNICDYILAFPADDLMLGATDFVLASLGNLNNDATTQREQAAFWMLGELGAPTLYRRPVNLFVNGQQRGLVYEDAQQPSGDTVKEWFSDDTNGDLHKIEDWFEFDTSGDNQLFNVDATLQNFTTTGGAKKLARYRWNWRKRAVNDSANDYAEFFQLVDAVNTVQPEPYNSQVQRLVDYEEWARVMALEHLVGNWDSYGHSRGKNMYAYKPQNGKWTLLAWDIDFVFDNGGDYPTTDLNPGSMPINDGTMRTFLSFPPIQRAWWRALQDAVNGPLLDAKVSAFMNAKYQGLAAAGLPVADPSGPLAYIASRRSYIQSLLAGVAFNFAITSGNNFSTNRNYISISGTAPIGVSTITINGVPFPVTWSSVS
ncbi:MAG TPA: lamin tail domain-containing protein, partial [Verrucomicrobiae bacterium]